MCCHQREPSPLEFDQSNLREKRIAMVEDAPLDFWSQNDPPVGGVLDSANSMFVQSGGFGDLPVFGLRKKVWADIILNRGAAASPIGLTETALLGLRSTGIVLAPMLLVVGNHAEQTVAVENDPIFDSPKQAPIPLWALGQHTRIGLDGFRRYISQSTRIRALLSDASDGSVSRPKTIGGLVYRLDCGQLRHRRGSALAYNLKHQATHIGWGITDAAVPEALSIIKDEFDLMNACRAEALKAHLA